MLKKQKKRLKAIAILLLLVLSMNACNQSNAVSDADDEGDMNAEKGQFVECEVTPEGMDVILSAPVKMNDGSLVFYGKKKDDHSVHIKYRSTDQGETFKEETAEWDEQMEGRAVKVSLLPDGTLFYMCMLKSEDGTETEHITSWVYRNEQWSQLHSLDDELLFAVQLMNQDTVFVSGIDISGNEFFYLIDLATEHIIKSVEGIDVGDYGMMNGSAIDLSNKDNPKLYYVDRIEGKQVLNTLDIHGNTEKKLGEDVIKNERGTTDEQGNYYYINNQGISSISPTDGNCKQVTEQEGFLLHSSSSTCIGMTYIDDKNLLCAISSMTEDAKLMKYVWDETASSVQKEVLKIWGLYENATIRAAIVQFCKNNPSVTVDYEVGMQNDSTQETDVICSLNTKMIAGNGPDVLILDGLDYENYVSKGYLSDLQNTVDMSLLQENIVDPFIGEDGSCYILPARFTVPILVGDEGELEDIHTLTDLKDAVLLCKPRPSQSISQDGDYEIWAPSEQYGIAAINMNMLVDIALKTSAPALIQEGKLNRDNLAQVMDFVGSIGQYYRIDKYPVPTVSNGVNVQNAEYDPLFLSDGIYEYSDMKHAKFGWGDVSTPSYFHECKRDRDSDQGEIYVNYQPGLLQKVYTPSALLSVTVSSEKQELAGQFIATVLDKSIQEVCYSDGNPVCKSALDSSIKKHKNYVADGGYKGDLSKFYEDLETPVILSGDYLILREYIYKHGMAMAAGSETLQQAISGVENDVALMFEEDN